ncbi:hypothetical protein AVEN_79436-1 [Araneus ventricosus]|uniref:Mariner Mos1 transposase n=1 Tax=Araneus ventricosus TaxID=182803 RepID=A0A4Y2I285_ARAVE|nr:hypothetical protein AVEN_79436-1 [Araneus ventricosus]
MASWVSAPTQRNHHWETLSNTIGATEQRIGEKRRDYETRHGKVIFQYDNASLHVTKPPKETVEELNFDVLPHTPYSADISSSDYHLFD